MTDLFLIPGYRYCGPGNELKGQKPRNSLDNYCRIHDEAYDKFEKTPYLEFVDGDRDLNRTIAREYTWDNYKRGKYSAGESLTAKFVQGVFKAKEFLAPHNLSMPGNHHQTPQKRTSRPTVLPLQKAPRLDGDGSSMDVEQGQQNATNTYAQCSAAARGAGAPLGISTDVALRTKPTIRWGLEDYSTAVIGKSNTQTKQYSVREPFRFNLRSNQAERNLTFFSVRHSAVSKPTLHVATDTDTYPDLNGYKTLLPGNNTGAGGVDSYPIKNCGFSATSNVPGNSQNWDTLSQLNICELENASFNLMTNRKITQIPTTINLNALTLDELYKDNFTRTYPYISMNTENFGASAPQFVNTDNKQFGVDLPVPTDDKIITNLGRGSVKFLMYNSSDTPAVVTIIKYKTQAVKTPMLLNGLSLTADSPGPGTNIVTQLIERKLLALEQISVNQKFNSSGRIDEAIDIVSRPKCRALPENTKFKGNQTVIPFVTDNASSLFNNRLDSVPFKEVDRIALTIPAGQRQTTVCQLPPVSYDSAKDLNRAPYVAAMNTVAPGNAINVQGGGWSSQHGYTFAVLVNGMPLMSEAGDGAGEMGTGRIVDIQEAPTEIYVEGIYSETVLPSVNRHSSSRTASNNSGLTDIAGVKAIRIIPMSEAVRTTEGSTAGFSGAVGTPAVAP